MVGHDDLVRWGPFPARGQLPHPGASLGEVLDVQVGQRGQGCCQFRIKVHAATPLPTF